VAVTLLALWGAVLASLIAAAPFAGLRQMTVVYTGMILAGIGMFLRERVLVRVEK